MHKPLKAGDLLELEQTVYSPAGSAVTRSGIAVVVAPLVPAAPIAAATAATGSAQAARCACDDGADSTRHALHCQCETPTGDHFGAIGYCTSCERWICRREASERAWGTGRYRTPLLRDDGPVLAPTAQRRGHPAEFYSGHRWMECGTCGAAWVGDPDWTMCPHCGPSEAVRQVR